MPGPSSPDLISQKASDPPRLETKRTLKEAVHPTEITPETPKDVLRQLEAVTQYLSNPETAQNMFRLAMYDPDVERNRRFKDELRAFVRMGEADGEEEKSV